MNDNRIQILSILVENTAGVLSQVTRLFSRKGYNIESLAVGTTDDPSVSRITVVIDVSDRMATQIASQLGKLLCVISVKVLNPSECVRRELILVKVLADSRDKRDEILQIVNIFRAKVVDVGAETLTVEITGDSSKAEAILNLLASFGIIELVRTGTVSLQRGKASIND